MNEVYLEPKQHNNKQEKSQTEWEQAGITGPSHLRFIRTCSRVLFLPPPGLNATKHVTTIVKFLICKHESLFNLSDNSTSEAVKSCTFLSFFDRM